MKDSEKLCLDLLRRIYRNSDNVVRAIKDMQRDDEGALLERIDEIQDNIAVLIRDIRRKDGESGSR